MNHRLAISRSCGGAVPWQRCKEDDEMVIVITTQRVVVDALAVQSSLIHQNQLTHKLPIFDTSLDAHQTIHSLASNTAHVATHHDREETPTRERESQERNMCTPVTIQQVFFHLIPLVEGSAGQNPTADL
eukprot:scaffold15438_cov85-Skeletonema_dohrnii-CCMP3373.AAC.4